MDKGKGKALGGLIFGIGLIFLLIGTMTQVYSTTTGVIFALAIWFIGGAVAKLIFGGEKKEPPQS